MYRSLTRFFSAIPFDDPTEFSENLNSRRSLQKQELQIFYSNRVRKPDYRVSADEESIYSCSLAFVPTRERGKGIMWERDENRLFFRKI
ncbi:Uncharacterized protein dnm_076450 [Desulfonema magnum]|uniref:Uncharacterized protein n=1 Tax=Desulfonema magnum TaxID=45655 RepID=A0A975GS16_9BACT|nr:Uncharacterized protein dnm_076450 [Desulfonema magnum]